ncbi:MAG: M20 metallopeptidase family protein [Nonlabens sp.]|uniref:M20 metallopeptidase family protein n=1 Tax=Nonlabens sp. TaxID=1888209 RepID=UPI003EF8377B
MFRISISVLLVCLLASCDQELDSSQVEQHSNSIFQELVSIRRDIHKNPELSGNEKRTAQIVSDYLEQLGMEVHSDFSGHGVIGILNGHKKGPKIAWRSDMDAIPYNNTDTEFFKSVNDSIGHMCGHDLHTTIGLGIASTLSQFKDDIDGTIYFIFQPSEETFTGARNMVNDGLFELIQPDEIYGLHVFPTQTGTISTKADELFAYERTIEIKMSKDINQIDFKNEFEDFFKGFERQDSRSSPRSLEHIVSEEYGVAAEQSIYNDFFFSIPGMNIKENENSISFTKTFFETDVKLLEFIKNQNKDFIENSDYSNHLLSIAYSRANPTVLNDTKLTEHLLSSFKDARGNPLINPLYGQVPYFNEDFIYFQEHVPGVLFFLGASNEEKGITAMPHSPDFKADEDAIKYGVAQFSKLLIDRANNIQ